MPKSEILTHSGEGEAIRILCGYTIVSEICRLWTDGLGLFHGSSPVSGRVPHLWL